MDQVVYATNTQRAILADLAIFDAWCADNGGKFFPAPPQMVADFVDAMAQARAPASVRRYVSSIATFHRAARLESPCASAIVKLALKRMRREKGRLQDQRDPLCRDRIERMLRAAGRTLIDARNKALLAVAYDTFCRRSELSDLAMEDLDFRPTRRDASIIIRKSKTDQAGVGMVRYLASDTVGYLQDWIAVSGVINGPVFRSITKRGEIGKSLHPSSVARAFKAMAVDAGIEADKVSVNSARIGATRDMIHSGIDLPAIMQAGGWRGAETVHRFAGRPASRSGAIELSKRQGRSA